MERIKNIIRKVTLKMFLYLLSIFIRLYNLMLAIIQRIINWYFKKHYPRKKKDNKNKNILSKIFTKKNFIILIIIIIIYYFSTLLFDTDSWFNYIQVWILLPLMEVLHYIVHYIEQKTVCYMGDNPNSNWNKLYNSIPSSEISEMGESGKKFLLLKREIAEIKETMNQNTDILSTVDNAEKLNNRLPDKAKDANTYLYSLKTEFSSFFDEESGNSIKEGLKEVKEFIKEEQTNLNNQLKKAESTILKLVNSKDKD